MADECSSSPTEQESHSNESCGLFMGALGDIQKETTDFCPRMDFRALLATHLRMIHELGSVNQQH